MTVETIELAPGYRISRMLRGGWQLAGGHGAIEAERAIADMAAFVDAGVTTFDCADIYTGVEEMIGRFRQRMLAERGSEALKNFKVHTKFVPDWDALLPRRPCLRARDHRPLAPAAQDGASRSRAVPLVELRRSRRRRDRAHPQGASG